MPVASADVSGIPITSTPIIAAVNIEGDAQVFFRNDGAVDLTFTVNVYPDGVTPIPLADLNLDLRGLVPGATALVTLPKVRPWVVGISATAALDGGVAHAEIVQATVTRARSRYGH